MRADIDTDTMPAERKMSVGERADRVGITPANPAVLKTAESIRSA
jgi:DNA-binding Xre family transcriptional regulator